MSYNYPTNWIGGKPRGGIKNIPTGYLVVLSPPNQNQINTYFIFNNYSSKEEALIAANQYMKRKSDEFELTRNQFRYLNRNTIEVKLTKDKTMKTDSIFIKQVQKYPINLNFKNVKDGRRYFARCQNKKTTFLFADLICDYKIVDFINNDSLDLRLLNLKDRTSKNKNIIIDDGNILNDDEFVCAYCYKKLNIKEFPKTQDGPDGHDVQCTHCYLKSIIAYNQYEYDEEISCFLDKLKYYNKAKNIIEEKGGKLLSPLSSYKIAHSKLKIKCPYDHIFHCTLSNLNHNRWCPDCNFWIGEKISKSAIEFLLDKPFPKVRPSWLKTDNDTLLELDGFNEELKIAFEYQGEQHYNFIEYFHKTEENFKKRLEYDKLKEILCKNNNVFLIIIPYTTQNEKICKFIAEKLLELNYVISDEKINSFNIDKIYEFDSNNKLMEFIKLIESKGGKFIDGVYLSRESYVTIECDKKHQWTTKIKYIQHGAWCHPCGFIVDDERKEKISDGMKKFLSTDKGKEIKSKSFIKRSETMKEQRDEIRATITHKTCNTCKLEKPKSEFGNKTAAKDGLQTNCKKCVLSIKKEWRNKNKNIILNNQT